MSKNDSMLAHDFFCESEQVAPGIESPCACAYRSGRGLIPAFRAQTLREASAALDEDTAFYAVIEKRIVSNAAFNELGIVDDVQDHMVAWLVSRAEDEEAEL